MSHNSFRTYAALIVLLSLPAASFAQQAVNQAVRSTETSAMPESSELQLAGRLDADDSASVSLEERLANLEKAWDDLKKSEAKAPSPSTKPTLEVHGRIHFDHWSFANDSQGSSVVRESWNGR